MHLLANYRTIQPPLRLGSVVRLTTTLLPPQGRGEGEAPKWPDALAASLRFFRNLAWLLGRFHGAKSWLSNPTNLAASPCRPGPP